VDREKLLDLSGRGRKRQEELARKFGIRDYPQPAGGCLLTETRYSQRLKELMAHEGLLRRDIELLGLGRHFRLEGGAKLVVGRNRSENHRLLDLAGGEDAVIRPAEGIKGPVGIVRGRLTDDDLQAAGRILARYCDRVEDQPVEVNCLRAGSRSAFSVNRPAEEFVLKWQI
jgi:hypothetical protein